MTREETIARLKLDRDLCNFNPMTGEKEPMNEDCRKSAEALDMAIKALDQVAKLRELQKNLAEKERFYAKESYDHTQYSNGLADAYYTTNELIDEILGDR